MDIIDDQDEYLRETGRWEEPVETGSELADILYSPEVRNANLAEYLEETELAKIGEQVHLDYEIDNDSCYEWKKRTDPAVDLAMLTWEQKNEPFENSSNVKYPLLTIAAIQFSARALPSIVKGKDIVKGKIIGRDQLQSPDGKMVPGAKTTLKNRISEHMSWQLLEQMEEWTEDLDRALICLPIIGEEWKKTYFSPILKRNVSLRVGSENIVFNYWAKSSAGPNRISERLWLYENEIEEHKRGGHFLAVDIPIASSSDDEDENERTDPRDEDRLILFIEQHRLLDLDDDGYKEPYIVTIHKGTRKVVRISPRYEVEKIERNANGEISKIPAVNYYTQMTFFPSPDGGSRGMGLGNLITPINESINSILNLLINAGNLATNPSGFIGKTAAQDRKLQGDIKFKLGEWKKVNIPGDDLKKAIVPLPIKEPSPVLFSLLGLLINSGKELSSVSELLSGESPGANTQPTTILALIEQGLKVFSSVYARIHRSLKAEFKKLYRLNSIYLDEKEYFTVLDNEKAIGKIDYNIEGIDIVPVSNPNEVSDTQKLLQAETFRGLLGQGFNDQAIRRKYVGLIAEMTGIEDPETLLIPDAQLGKPSPEMQIEARKMALEEKQFEWKVRKGQAEIMKLRAMALKAIAEAEALEAGSNIEEYKAQLIAYKTQMDFLNSEAERFVNERMAAAPENAGIQEAP